MKVKTLFFVLLAVMLMSSITMADGFFDIEVPNITDENEITVDGDLSDWVGIPGIFIYSTWGQIPDEIRGEADLSATAWIAYDEDNVYLAVRVTDNELVFERSGGNIWQNDCVELWIDGLQFGFALVDGEPYAHVFSGRYRQDEIDVAIVEELNGYTVEVALPVAEFRNTDIEAGQDFRLAIGVDNANKSTSGRVGQIYYPDSFQFPQQETFAHAVFDF